MYYINPIRHIEFVLSFLLAALITWLVVYVPPYEEWVYEKSPVINSIGSKYVTGYMPGNEILRVRTYAEMHSSEEGFVRFTMEVNTNQLIPTGIYRRTEGTGETYQTNRLKVKLLKSKAMYAQFYILVLEDGDRIPILINDNVIKKKFKKIEQLPIGMLDTSYGLYTYYNYDKEKMEQLYGISVAEKRAFFINAASDFAAGDEIKKLRSYQSTAAIIIFLVILFGSSILFFVLGKIMKGQGE